MIQKSLTYLGQFATSVDHRLEVSVQMRPAKLATLDLAPRSSEREDSDELKTFVRNPAGNQSRPVEPGQRPEASLAWWVGDCPCEA
jgi:hypothetical protein